MSSKKKKDQGGLSWTSLKKEWLAWYSGKSPIFLFVVKWGLLMALLYILLFLPVCDRMLFSYLEGNGWLANIILNGLGQKSTFEVLTLPSPAVIISSPQFVMGIKRGCDAVEPTWLFCAALVAFPAPWRNKIIGMLVGIVVLQVLNLIRIVSLYFIGIHFRPYFDTIHLDIWPAVFIGVAILLWFGWMEWTNRKPAPKA